MSHASKTVLKILTCRLESTAELYLGRISLVLGKVVAQEMQLWHCACCMKETETWNTTIKSMSVTLTKKKFLIV